MANVTQNAPPMISESGTTLPTQQRRRRRNTSGTTRTRRTSSTQSFGALKSTVGSTLAVPMYQHLYALGIIDRSFNPDDAVAAITNVLSWKL